MELQEGEQVHKNSGLSMHEFHMRLFNALKGSLIERPMVAATSDLWSKSLYSLGVGGMWNQKKGQELTWYSL